MHQSSLSEDIYLILSGFSEVDRNHATLKVLVRPLVIWMWIGGFVIALGTLICISPMRQDRIRGDMSSLESQLYRSTSAFERSED